MAPLPEAALRVQVLHTAQRAASAGYIVAGLGNVSVRHGRIVDRLLITPSGVPYETMSASQIVALGVDGTVREAPCGLEPSSEWRLHAAIYRARSDVHAIVHTHAVHAQAFSFLGRSLRAETEELARVAGGDVRVAEHANSGTEALAQNAVRALGDRHAVLLARHGAVTVGASLDAAYAVTQIVQRQAHRAWLLAET
jgi:L-fuculose-phosphate aldolase